jgi:transcriptional regulator with XRE-family HTH domain
MAELTRHWTESSVDDFLYRIAADYVRQLEQLMEVGGMSQAELAKLLGVTEGRVSQVLNNPGNLTLRKMIEYSRALGRKVSVVAYDDNDPENQSGPINAEVFAVCWEQAGKPSDFFELREHEATAANTVANIHRWGVNESPSLDFTIYEMQETSGNPASSQPVWEL